MTWYEDWYRIVVLLCAGVLFVCGMFIAGNIGKALSEARDKRRNR